MVQPSGSFANSFSKTQIRGIIAAIAAITAVGLSLSASLPLLTLTLEHRGVSDTWIGLNTAFSGIASIIATPVGPYLARKLGTPQALLISLLVAGVSLPFFFVLENFWAWFPLRLLFHGATTSAFILSEFWINALAPPKHRGLLMGVYATVLSLGFASGPLMLALAGTTGLLPFLLAGAAIIIAALPVLIGFNAAPRIEREASSKLYAFLWIAPAATLAGFVFGAVEQSSISLLPLYGLKIGLTPVTATLLVSAMAAGNMILQIPLGMLSDRMNRRHLLIYCGAFGVLGTLLMIPLSGSLIGILVLLFLWGGVVAGLYTVGLTHLGARFEGGDLASANAAFVLMYSIGQLVGPATTGIALSAWGASGLPLVFAGFLAGYVIICLIRGARLRAAP
ncbi:MFS transporter [Pseudovibrio sp. Tun.PSC04-5.I4]|uniref:MFS transporter n=1 Tax=Pseudovibrio sp. Tun.PSC04-5.I4 TaxID=1798213 RepID=UPI00088D39B8|nr:MFS transporter [Pseudovibrio sp. Tun.PSC04-5.I4]SDR39393.1 Cyanate permease [Pseudovibrio sp. Tun.PSC04-5.I4]